MSIDFEVPAEATAIRETSASGLHDDFTAPGKGTDTTSRKCGQMAQDARASGLVDARIVCRSEKKNIGGRWAGRPCSAHAAGAVELDESICAMRAGLDEPAGRRRCLDDDHACRRYGYGHSEETSPQTA